jgi:hypothetical protein
VNAAIQALHRMRDAPRRRAGECCDLCGEDVPDAHQHVVDLRARSLLCTCRGCWLLFTPDGAGGGHFRAVPDRYASVHGFTLGSGTWDAFQIPVSVAFFFHNSDLGQVAAFYPSPAGATESLLDLAAWDELVAANPVLSSLLPDVEAVLVRVTEGEASAFVVPIDACYELVGLVRTTWRGFDGGTEARQALDSFFQRVGERAR